MMREAMCCQREKKILDPESNTYFHSCIRNLSLHISDSVVLTQRDGELQERFHHDPDLGSILRTPGPWTCFFSLIQMFLETFPETVSEKTGRDREHGHSDDHRHHTQAFPPDSVLRIEGEFPCQIQKAPPHGAGNAVVFSFHLQHGTHQSISL